MKLKGEEQVLFWGFVVGFALMGLGIGILVTYSLFCQPQRPVF